MFVNHFQSPSLVLSEKGWRSASSRNRHQALTAAAMPIPARAARLGSCSAGAGQHRKALALGPCGRTTRAAAGS